MFREVLTLLGSSLGAWLGHEVDSYITSKRNLDRYEPSQYDDDDNQSNNDEE